MSSIIERMIISLLFFTLLAQCNSDLDKISEIKHDIPMPSAGTIVYQSAEPPLGWHIALASDDYRRRFNLTPGFFDITPEWSPDKRWIVFVRGLPPDTNLRIWKMKYNGDSKIALTPPDKNSSGPQISPDGRWIAFSVRTGKKYDIFIMDTSGRQWQQITNNSTIPFYEMAIYAHPNWAPDGRRIVFDFYRFDTGMSSSLAILDLTTNHFTHLSSVDSLYPYKPDWSPTRDEIVFVCNSPCGGGPKIFRVNADGSNIIQLTSSWGNDEPNWSSDGEMIAYASRDSMQGHDSIWIMNRDGSNKRKLIEIPGADVTAPAW